ncbi:hypothetical protein V6N12_015062 [Hibiscus sabdariffa]|uniref:Uncharacterized protein n=1 Tax=Hibiscus sabdariffa TaxID=183260 RepID=A0ABR2DMY6_9ROSI
MFSSFNDAIGSHFSKDKENFEELRERWKTNKEARLNGSGTGWDGGKNGSCDSPLPSPKVDEYPSKPTRIVELKPSPRKSQDIKTVASQSPSSPRILLGLVTIILPLPYQEAKKRLSERWAMMASNGNSQEQRHVRRSSSTLDEMIALSDAKKLGRSEEEETTKEQEPRGSTSCIANNLNKEENTCDSPKNLFRSKSVHVSSTAHGARLNIEISDPESSNEQIPKELTKAKNIKSSL